MFSDGCGHYKIGISKDPSKRILQCQTGNPKSLYLEAVSGEPMPRSKALDIERSIHIGLRSVRVSGEWFKLDSSSHLLEMVKREMRA